MLAALALLAVACSRSPHLTESDPASDRDAQVSAEPEPAGGAVKSLATGCNEPVVRLLIEPRDRFDSRRAAELVRVLVRENPEFGVAGIHYAEAEKDGNRLLLARCPDAETANRIARRAREKDKSARAVPLCGYASSGWTLAVQRVPTQ